MTVGVEWKPASSLMSHRADSTVARIIARANSIGWMLLLFMVSTDGELERCFSMTPIYIRETPSN